MAAKARRLEEWEKDFIRLTYPTETGTTIGNILGLKRYAVNYHARRLGVPKVEKVHVGDRYEKLVVVACVDRTRSGKKWLCKCDCGNEVVAIGHSLYFELTRSCGCIRKKKHWSGTKSINGSLIGGIKRGAQNRGFIYNLTDDFLEDLLVQQEFKCALTGVDIAAYHKSKTTASLDRIDSSKGYTRDNVQWVHKDVNYLKQDFDEDEFFSWCELVTNYRKNKCRVLLQAS